jgi:hypothetical protein
LKYTTDDKDEDEFDGGWEVVNVLKCLISCFVVWMSFCEEEQLLMMVLVEEKLLVVVEGHHPRGKGCGRLRRVKR